MIWLGPTECTGYKVCGLIRLTGCSYEYSENVESGTKDRIECDVARWGKTKTQITKKTMRTIHDKRLSNMFQAVFKDEHVGWKACVISVSWLPFYWRLRKVPIWWWNALNKVEGLGGWWLYGACAFCGDQAATLTIWSPSKDPTSWSRNVRVV